MDAGTGRLEGTHRAGTAAGAVAAEVAVIEVVASLSGMLCFSVRLMRMSHCKFLLWYRNQKIIWELASLQ